MKAHISLIKSALATGPVTFLTFCGRNDVVTTTTFQDTVDIIEDLEECWVEIQHQVDGKLAVLANVYVVHDGDDDTIADYLCNRDGSDNWADRWFDAYQNDSTYAGVAK